MFKLRVGVCTGRNGMAEARNRYCHFFPKEHTGGQHGTSEADVMQIAFVALMAFAAGAGIALLCVYLSEPAL